jgi:lysophospholipase L1-like esterase
MIGLARSARTDVGTARRHGTSRRLMVGRLVAVLVALLVPLLLLEAALRLFGPILPGNYDTGHYLVRHARLGHFNEPNFDGWIKTSEFTTHVRIGPLGLRDPRGEYARPPETHRILLLGDSFTEAVQVDASQTVASRLETSLRGQSGRNVEVINAGVAGYGTGQEMLLLDEEGLRYQPQVVVLLVFLGNDIGDNSYRPNLENAAISSRPSFELDNEKLIRVVPGTPPEAYHDWRQPLRDCCLLYNVFETGVLMKLANGPLRDQPEVSDDARYLVRSLYETKPDGEMARAWRITERLIGMIRDRTNTEGIKLVVVGAPDWLALDEAAWQERMGESRASTKRYAPDFPNKLIGEMMGRAGVPYLDLMPILAESAGDGPLYFPIDTHWTPAGHAVVATAIEAKLHELGLDGR